MANESNAVNTITNTINSLLPPEPATATPNCDQCAIQLAEIQALLTRYIQQMKPLLILLECKDCQAPKAINDEELNKIRTKQGLKTRPHTHQPRSHSRRRGNANIVSPGAFDPEKLAKLDTTPGTDKRGEFGVAMQ